MKVTKWLSHLKEDMFVGANNDHLCAYALSLEGWRRGLALTFYSRKIKRTKIHVPGRLFSLSDGKKTHFFYKTKGDKVSNNALKICGDKNLTKEYLKKANIPIPEGRFFSKDNSDREIIEYGKKIGFPVVLKPVTGAQGIGVIANIIDEDSLDKAVDHVRYKLNKKDVLLEKFVKGEEYRFFVIEDEVYAVLKRTPANIVGDGKHTIDELIKLKNNERKKNPRLTSCLIKKDFEMKNRMKKVNYSFSDIPPKDEIVFLREKSNISTGGDSEELTDLMPDSVKQVAINTLKGIPDLPHGGVDIIVDLSSEEYKPVVLEINAIPQIGSLLFPMEGHAQDIPEKLIDYYFPETIRDEYFNEKVFYDFAKTIQPLREKIAQEIVVIPAPKKFDVVKEIKMDGEFRKNSFNFIRRRAIEMDLQGNVKINKDHVDIVIAGDKKDIQRFEDFLQGNNKYFKLSAIDPREVDMSVKVGFEIIENKKELGNENKKEVNKTILTRMKSKLLQILRIK